MRGRRLFLAAGVGLLVLSAAQRSGAKVKGEVEATGYAGATSGGWICGPLGTMRYGGIAISGSISKREATPEEGEGGTATVAVGAEWQSVRVISPPFKGAPPDSLMFGAQATAGYRWRGVSLEGGSGLYEGYRSATPLGAESRVLPYPTVELVIGPRDTAYGVFGVGSPLSTTLLRPGIYLGGGFLSYSGFGVDVRTGMFRQGPGALDALGYRLDLVGRGPIPGTEKVWLRLGGSVGGHEDEATPVDYEGSIGVMVGY